MKYLITILFLIGTVYGQRVYTFKDGEYQIRFDPITGSRDTVPNITQTDTLERVQRLTNNQPFTLLNFNGNYPSAQSGTAIHAISSGVTTNARFSLDTYNGSNVLGSVFQGRRAAGTALSPSAATTDYTLAGLVGDGYGVDSFHNISVGSFLDRKSVV